MSASICMQAEQQAPTEVDDINMEDTSDNQASSAASVMNEVSNDSEPSTLEVGDSEDVYLQDVIPANEEVKDAQLESSSAHQDQIQAGAEAASPPPPPKRVIRRDHYSRAQQDYAVFLLDMGMKCAAVAKEIGPFCNAVTVYRWQKKARVEAVARGKLSNMIKKVKYEVKF